MERRLGVNGTEEYGTRANRTHPKNALSLRSESESSHFLQVGGCRTAWLQAPARCPMPAEAVRPWHGGYRTFASALPNRALQPMVARGPTLSATACTSTQRVGFSAALSEPSAPSRRRRSRAPRIAPTSNGARSDLGAPVRAPRAHPPPSLLAGSACPFAPGLVLGTAASAAGAAPDELDFGGAGTVSLWSEVPASTGLGALPLSLAVEASGAPSAGPASTMEASL
jgi:hypothetical protein